MKINTALYKVSSLVLFGLVISAGTLAYTKAEGNQITVCVKKSGFVYVIGEEFKRDECKKNDSLLSWNTTGIQGQKGDKGDIGATGPQGLQGIQGDVGPVGPKGIKGDSAIQGGGNIAFCSDSPDPDCRVVLKKDGTVWISNGINSWYQDLSSAGTVPVPVEEIAEWHRMTLLTKLGDIWVHTGQGWQNFGQPN